MPVCPPEAIFPEEDVPEEHAADTQRNADYFAEGPGYWDYDLEEEVFFDYDSMKIQFEQESANESKPRPTRDFDIEKAVKIYFDKANLKVEPTGALSLACVMSNKDKFKRSRI